LAVVKHHPQPFSGGDTGEAVAAIPGGKLDFSPWEHIFYGELDGRRTRRVPDRIIKEQCLPPTPDQPSRNMRERRIMEMD